MNYNIFSKNDILLLKGTQNQNTSRAQFIELPKL